MPWPVFGSQDSLFATPKRVLQAVGPGPRQTLHPVFYIGRAGLGKKNH